MAVAHPATRPVEPWFRSHPDLALTVAALIFVSVFLFRISVQGNRDTINLLFVLPIALIAIAFGARAGIIAGTVAVLLVGAWVRLSGVDLTPLGWATRVLPMVLLGALLGAASDRLREAADLKRRLQLFAVRQRDAAEINDSIIQGLVVAKWSLESGRVDQGITLLNESIETAETLVAELLASDEDRAVCAAPSAVPAAEAHDVTVPDPGPKRGRRLLSRGRYRAAPNL